MRLVGILTTGILASACGDTIGQQVALELSGSGSGEATFVQGTWEITLDRAEIGFGPLYFCPASIPSDELCATALVELRSAVTIDGLDSRPQQLPPLEGTTGTVRSAVFDYGISWPLTFRSPSPSPGAPGGHSARFAGIASDGTRLLRFSADVDVEVNAPGRLATGTTTEHVIEDDSSRLHVVFDPARWWRNVDFEALASDAFSELDAEDAAAEADVPIEPGTAAYGSLIHEMTAGAARPRFEWSRSPE